MATSDTVAFWQATSDSKGSSQWVNGLQDHFKKASQIENLPWQWHQGSLQTCLTPTSFWKIYSFASAGKVAIRTGFDPNTIQSVKLHRRTIPELPIPLEDISTGWKQAGQVGQEVCGGALPYILTTYAYKRFEEVPVIVFSEYSIYRADYQLADEGSGYVVYELSGTPEGSCRVRLLAKNRQLTPGSLFDEDGDLAKPFKPLQAEKTYQEYQVKGDLWLRIEWSKK